MDFRLVTSSRFVLTEAIMLFGELIIGWPTLQKIGKVLLFFVGAGFVFIQVRVWTRWLGKFSGIADGRAFHQYLVHKDFVKVNWDVVSDRFYRRFDRDRDGKVSTKDVGSVFGRLIRFLTYQVPFAAGFTVSLH